MKDSFMKANVTLFDINQRRMVGSCIVNGRGPNEFIQVNIAQIGDSLLQVSDKKRIVIIPMQEILHKKIKYNHVFGRSKFKLDDYEFVKDVYYMSDSTFWASGYFKNSKFALFNFRNDSVKNVKYISDYPEDKREEHQGENNITKMSSFQGKLYWSDDMRKVLYVSQTCYYFETYEIKDNNPVKLHEQVYYLPEYEVGYDKTAIFPRKKSKTGLWGAAGKDNVYVSYSGRTKKEYGKYSIYSNTIHVYTWYGDKVAEYKLDRDIYHFDVDEKSGRIYVISVNPKTDLFDIGYYEI